MTLRLRVVSDQRRMLGDRSTIEFSADGGTIGRSADNDWVLPDPLRYVSAHHARVQQRDGHYYFEDLSTNGSFLNDEEQAVSKRNPDGYRLQVGDLLRVGHYQIVVVETIQPGEDATPPDAEDAAAAVPTSIHGLRTLGRAAQTDIGAMLNLDELLVPDSSASPTSPSASSTSDSSTGDRYRPVDAYGQSIGRAAARPQEAAKAVAAAEAESAIVARRMAKLAKAANRDARSAVSVPALYDMQSALQAFTRGAGIDAEKLSPDAQTRMLHLAGQLFREALVGFKELERTRHELRNRFRIEIPTEADDPRPSLERLTVDELMIQLLQQHETRQLDAVQWLRESVAEAKRHENAASQAMRAAFVEFLGRLDPAELEARFERAARRGKARSADKAQYWDLFTTFYRNLIEMPADHLPHTFVEAFASAYREHLKKVD